MGKVVILSLLIFGSCMSQPPKTIRYISLGDSYTIGTGAEEQEAWPVLLTKYLNDKGVKTQLWPTRRAMAIARRI